MEDIVLLHEKTNQKNESPFPRFQTCLRQITFVPKAELHHLPEISGDLISGESATAFLIETLCGLHSPVIGETEVFGQFKSFLEKEIANPSNLLNQAALKRWINYIFQQVKEIRTHHLKDQGPSCYGSFVRSLVKHKPQASVFGSGHLAKEILPWFETLTEVQVFCRSKETTAQDEFFKTRSSVLQEYQELENHAIQNLIITATMSDECIVKEVRRLPQPPKLIIDLRRRESYEPLFSSEVEYHHLNDFFKVSEKMTSHLQEKRHHLIDLIKQKALSFHLRMDIRPMGWDDICA
jgi:glutamyl-tRNA reductase